MGVGSVPLAACQPVRAYDGSQLLWAGLPVVGGSPDPHTERFFAWGVLRSGTARRYERG